MLLVRDGSFDKDNVYALRVLLLVHERGVDDVDTSGEIDEKLVEVQE
jgi:hypothetical protein